MPIDTLTPDRRRELAAIVGCSPATLYQAVFLKQARLSPAECVRIETATAGELRRWDLRPNDWHEIWPELINSEGAPEVASQP